MDAAARAATRLGDRAEPQRRGQKGRRHRRGSRCSGAEPSTSPRRHPDRWLCSRLARASALDSARRPKPGAHAISFLPPTLPRTIVLFLVAFFFTGAGVMHFVSPEFFIAIVPPYLPAAAALVYVSGVFEILGGVGVLVPATRRWAGYGLLALLVAVYPANIHMALHPEQFPDATATALYVRLPFQFVFAAMVWFGACSPMSAARGEAVSAQSFEA